MITYLLQSSVCLMLFYMVYIAFFRAHTNYTFNRFYLLTTLVLSVIIPWVEISTTIESLVLTSTIGRTIQTTVDFDKSIFTTSNILFSIYFIGVLISSLVFLFKLLRLSRIIYKGDKQIIDGQNVVNVNEDIGICSFLKYILVPQDKHNKITGFELSHEKSHINQFHSIDIIAIWIYQSIFWFNPIAYLYRTRLLEVHEFLADRGAIQLMGKSGYQNYILDIVSQKLQPQLVNNFKSIIKTRLIMMNSNTKPSIWSYFTTIVAIFTMLFLFSCSAENAVRYTMTPHGPIEVTTETVIDTILTFDSETFKETVTYHKREIYIVVDTTIVIDFDTNEEMVTIIKTFLEPEDLIKNE